MDDSAECQAILEAVGHVVDRQAIVRLQLFLEPRSEGFRADMTFPTKPLLLVRRAVVALSHLLRGGEGVCSLDCRKLLFNLESKVTTV